MAAGIIMTLWPELCYIIGYHPSELLSLCFKAYPEGNKITWFQKVSLNLKTCLKWELQCESVCCQR